LLARPRLVIGDVSGDRSGGAVTVFVAVHIIARVIMRDAQAFHIQFIVDGKLWSVKG
jgi:hypothetical protein